MGIYHITCLPTGCAYVGSSDVIRRRWQKHRTLLRGNRHHNYLLQAAWNEHGETAFTFTMTEVITDLDLLIAAEQRCLDAAKAAGPTFNIAQDIASPYRGLVHTDEARAKMSVAIRASMTPERLQAMRERVQGEQNPGGKMTEATVLDIVRRLLGGEHPREIGASLGVVQESVYQIRSGRTWKHLVTAEQVTAMKAINQYGNRWKGVVPEELREHGRRLGQSNKGKILSPQRVEQISRRARGTGNPKVKLTEDQVREIKRLLVGSTSYKDCEILAVQFGVTPSTIYRIKTGETWTHVTSEPEPLGQLTFPIH
jgi:group I intron endonuclease